MTLSKEYKEEQKNWHLKGDKEMRNLSDTGRDGGRTKNTETDREQVEKTNLNATVQLV